MPSTSPPWRCRYAPGVGTVRSALNETGFFGGLGVSTESGQPVPTALSGTVSLQTDPVGSHVASTFSGRDPFGNADSAAVLNFGTTAGDGRARSVFIDNNLFAALESPDKPAVIGGTPAAQAGTALAMVTSGAVPNTSWMPTGVTPCDCQFLRWGYWTGQVPTPTAGQPNAVHSYPIGTWVTGLPTVTMPTTGSGSYSGAAVGTVFNNGATYLAAGQFAQTYDFAQRTGTANITNFDNASYTFSLISTGLNKSNFASPQTRIIPSAAASLARTRRRLAAISTSRQVPHISPPVFLPALRFRGRPTNRKATARGSSAGSLESPTDCANIRQARSGPRALYLEVTWHMVRSPAGRCGRRTPRLASTSACGSTCFVSTTTWRRRWR
jgi:hypothetical protein